MTPRLWVAIRQFQGSSGRLSAIISATLVTVLPAPSRRETGLSGTGSLALIPYQVHDAVGYPDFLGHVQVLLLAVGPDVVVKAQHGTRVGIVLAEKLRAYLAFVLVYLGCDPGVAGVPDSHVPFEVVPDRIHGQFDVDDGVHFGAVVFLGEKD